MLIAESEDGQYLPIGIVSTLREAREFARDDFGRRTQLVENGGSPFCPSAYSVWAQTTAGYQRVFQITDPLQGR